MEKNRLEAFSDGVLAIIITIMVLELKIPHETNLESLMPIIPVLLSYLLSFLYIGIYWNNHHHMLHTCKKVTGAILWANLHLLFWLSLVPFVTGWMGENNFAAIPCLFYGCVLLMAGASYFILQHTIISSQGENSLLKKAIGQDIKGKISPLLYVVAIALSFWSNWMALFIYIFVALMWIIPDQRIEKTLSK
ncbi:TMEM175 family protein [bacterium]|nr:TMEM175 family protein [bacterium]